MGERPCAGREVLVPLQLPWPEPFGQTASRARPFNPSGAAGALTLTLTLSHVPVFLGGLFRSVPWRCEIFPRRQEAHTQRMLELRGARTHSHSRGGQRGRRRAGGQR